jgi:hypothetical protein
MPTAHLEDLSNDDLLVQLNAFCEEVAERLVEYESAEDRDTLAEAVSFVSAVERAVGVSNGLAVEPGRALVDKETARGSRRRRAACQTRRGGCVRRLS